MIFEEEIWCNNNPIYINSICIYIKEIKCFASQNLMDKS